MSKNVNTNNSGPDSVGETAYALIKELFPICRSITGDGLRQTLGIVGRRIPLKINEVPSGTRVFDWTVPREWNIRDAYIKNSEGEKIVDFRQSNLHVLNYSVPVNKSVSLTELKEHLFSIPEHSEWIPYRTSYYRENWGFCLSHKQLQMLEEREYEVFIDSTLEDGSLSYGELFLQGEEDGEILFSCHACHPSLANDNLSGVAVATMLAQRLSSVRHRYSYRFLFIPGTIGAITWLALNQEKTGNIKHGLVLSGLGDAGPFTYKKSRIGDAEIDRAAAHALKHSGGLHNIIDFYPYGYDERQYCSPGFNLPVGRLSRTPFGEYPEYHTSADNLDFVRSDALDESFQILWSILRILENNGKFMNMNPHCEPQLGKRGLYSNIGKNELAMLWVLNLSDGNNTLLDIAERSGIEFTSIEDSARILSENNLLKENRV
jgi:aminopeptidase-like protein